jgi:hypothetical protein
MLVDEEKGRANTNLQLPVTIGSANALRFEYRQANGYPGLVTFIVRLTHRPGREDVAADLWPVGIDTAFDNMANFAYQR